MTDRKELTIQEVLEVHRQMTQQQELGLGETLGWFVLSVMIFFFLILFFVGAYEFAVH